MKKQFLLFAVVALGAALLTGCKNDPKDPSDPGDKASLTITPRELVLVLGDNPVSLTATLTPADASATIKWNSSNPSVVSVTSRGFVQALDYGDAYVYATCGELKDSCYVHVQTYLEAAVFNSAIVWEEDTTYLKDDQTGVIPVFDIESSSGEKYRAYKALATLYVFSDGFYIDNSGHFAGTEDGVIMEMEALMYYATAYLNNTDRGTVFCLGKWQVTDTATTKYVKMSLPGEMDEVEYMAQMKQFVNKFNDGDASYAVHLQAAAKALKNPTLNSYHYDTDESGQGGYYSSRVPEALCYRANMSLNGNFPASKYMCGMDYCLIEYQQLAADTLFESNWGLNLGWDEVNEKVYFNDEKVHFNPLTKSVYGNVPGEGDEDEAPAMTPIRVPVIKENPVLAAQIEEQLKNHPTIKMVRKKF